MKSHDWFLVGAACMVLIGFMLLPWVAFGNVPGVQVALAADTPLELAYWLVPVSALVVLALRRMKKPWAGALGLIAAPGYARFLMEIQSLQTENVQRFVGNLIGFGFWLTVLATVALLVVAVMMVMAQPAARVSE